MATKIVTKNSSTASAVPTASDLVQGELAVNVADKRLFTEDNAGAIVELGTNPSTLTVTGEITANGGIALGDNDKATFGASDDLQIYHDGSNSWIQDAGTGVLALKTDGAGISMLTSTGDTLFQANRDSDVRLYYDNSLKLATTSTGIDVTGTATMDGLTVDNTASFNYNGNENLFLADTANTSRSSFQVSGTANYFNANIDSASHGYYVWRSSNAYTERMRIDASGNVGIGTSSIAAGTKLQVAGETRIYPDSGTGVLRFGSGGAEKGKLSVDTSSNMAFETAGSERMRIDSSGNLLVGKTTQDLSTEGISINPLGYIQVTESASPTLYLNRLSTDGSIVNFYKDGATVGSINSFLSGRMGLGSGDTGVYFDSIRNQVQPFDPSANTPIDNTIDLGRDVYRYKDLYLSGGVYLGGTGAANKLDDYEEGTFSGTAAGSVYSGTYTKVGRICHISITIDNTSSTGTQLASLPFSSKNGGTSFNGSQPTFNSSSTQAGFYVAPYNGGAALFGYSRLGATINISSGSIAANFTYETD
jgi:hypothetical protein